MIKIEFDQSLINKSKKAERIYFKSKMKGYKDKFIDGNEIQANRIGKMGELVFKIFLDTEGFYYEYDESIEDLDEKDFILIDSKGIPRKIDVKTQLNDYTPRPDWNCEVNEKQKDKVMDYYVFIKLSENNKKSFFVGFIEYSEFWKIASLNPKGNIMYGGEKVKGTKYDVKIFDLFNPLDFYKVFKKKKDIQ